MQSVPFEVVAGYPYVHIAGRRWLFDSGSPTSFGDVDRIELDGVEFEVPDSSLGFTATKLAPLVGVECAGLLGVDLLGELDHRLDLDGGVLALSSDELEHHGELIAIEDCMGVPIVEAEIAGATHRMFFDTGASICYFQGGGIEAHPSAGRIRDFLPHAGAFETDTHLVPVRVGGAELVARCGRLPDAFGAALSIVGVSGIVGHALLKGRVASWFPRRGMLGL